MNSASSGVCEREKPVQWNPTMPFRTAGAKSDDAHGEDNVYLKWLSQYRDLGGKLAKHAPQRILVVLEGNQGGSYWRLLWPKDASKADQQWWQTVRLEPHADNDETLTMKTLQNGAEIAIEGITGVVERRPNESFCFWFVVKK